jgi:predicted nucleic acid-binding protein
MSTRCFFDASALIRVLERDPRFESYREEPVVTDIGHVYEFARYLLKRYGAARARELLQGLRADRVEATNDDLVEAAKLAARSSKLSAQDALGYVLARREDLVFLTTDRGFRGMPGVELVDVHERSK